MIGPVASDKSVVKLQFDCWLATGLLCNFQGHCRPLQPRIDNEFEEDSQTKSICAASEVNRENIGEAGDGGCVWVYSWRSAILRTRSRQNSLNWHWRLLDAMIQTSMGGHRYCGWKQVLPAREVVQCQICQHSNFQLCKVVRQHTEGVAGIVICILLEI